MTAFDAVTLETTLKATAAQLGVKAGVLVHPARLALTGGDQEFEDADVFVFLRLQQLDDLLGVGVQGLVEVRHFVRCADGIGTGEQRQGDECEAKGSATHSRDSPLGFLSEPEASAEVLR